jgi:hypothetical protein
MYDLPPPVDPPPRGPDAQAEPPADFGGLDEASHLHRQQGVNPLTGRKAGRSTSWSPLALLESALVLALGGGRPKRRALRPPLPLPTVMAVGNRPIAPPPVCQPLDDTQFLPKVLWNRLAAWAREKGRYHVVSTIAHAMAIIAIGLLAGHFQVSARHDEPAFDATLGTALPQNDIVRFKLGDAPLEPSVLDTAALEPSEPVGQIEQINDDSLVFEEKGGGKIADSEDNLGGIGGFEFKAIGAGPAVQGPGGVGMGVGTGDHAGSGGAGTGFGGRGSGMREAMAGAFGATRQTERAVAAALNWIARHQSPAGSWSLEDFSRRCKDKTCSGPGDTKSDAAATALALLPFLAAGQTHQSKGPYQKTIRGGLHWLMNNQLSDGNLAGRGNFTLMYTHGLATITLCEAFALTSDPKIGVAAQSAVQFIETSQNTAGGGWRYTPGQPGDTSVTGWQVMALKSAQMAGLSVTPNVLKGAKKFLLSVASGSAGSEFSYLQGEEATPTMSAVGLLCSQYLGAARNDAIMVKGLSYLNRHHPLNEERDCYYWYYATQVMHNIPGPQWDAWNRILRRILVKTQIKDGCATGSWDPEKPVADEWGHHGGRLMQTSLSTLSLEVYYRYLPLYRLDGSGDQAPAASPEVETTDSPAADSKDSSAAPPAAGN